MAKALGARKEEITIDEIDGANVMILTYENQEQLKEAIKKNPLIMTLQHKKVDTETNKRIGWVKVRQWPVDADIEHVILLNDMLGWYGKVFPPRGNQKHTSAILKAPTEIEAKRLLEKGYIVSNGKLLAVVPEDSTREEEEKRTVLLVGINKANAKLKNDGGRLTELGLLKSLRSNGYPIQSLKFVYHDENRIGHSAYILLRKPTAAKDLQPYQDSTKRNHYQMGRNLRVRKDM